jgi:hypothetical protein
MLVRFLNNFVSSCIVDPRKIVFVFGDGAPRKITKNVFAGAEHGAQLEDLLG